MPDDPQFIETRRSWPKPLLLLGIVGLFLLAVLLFGPDGGRMRILLLAATGMLLVCSFFFRGLGSRSPLSPALTAWFSWTETETVGQLAVFLGVMTLIVLLLTTGFIKALSYFDLTIAIAHDASVSSDALGVLIVGTAIAVVTGAWYLIHTYVQLDAVKPGTWRSRALALFGLILFAALVWNSSPHNLIVLALAAAVIVGGLAFVRATRRK